MKKLFDFSDDNFILDKLWDWLKKKVPNKVIAVLLAILLDVSYIGLFFGFFVMPFISYSSLTLKIVFNVLWGISCAVWIISLIDDWKKQSKDDKWSTAIGLFCFIVFFGLCFVNNNYYHLGKWWQIAIVCVMLLLTIGAIYKFIKDLIQNPKDTLASLLMGILFVLGFLGILASSLDALEMDLRKKLLITGAFSVALPILALIIAYILGISKPKKVMEYGSLVIFCILVLIGISYIISFLNPETDGYQTFVTLLASLLGGGLTLVGVAWTIKKGDDDRKAENRRKAKPFIGIIDDYSKDSIEAYKNGIQFCKKLCDDSLEARIICYLENSDKCLFYLDKVQFEGVDYYPDSKKLISKNEKFAIFIMESKDYPNERKKITMFLTDENYEERIFDICLGKESCYEQIVERA